MSRRLLFLLLIGLAPLFCFAKMPTILRVVDLRTGGGDAEQQVWLSSLQGTINRQMDHGSAIFLLRSAEDEYWANVLTRTYNLKREDLSPKELLEKERTAISGQILYKTEQAWARNIALTAAAVADGNVIATNVDLGLTEADAGFPSEGWATRIEAYKWAQKEYNTKADKSMLALVPEGGCAFMDLVAARKLLAVDYALSEKEEAAAMTTLVAGLTDSCRILGSVSNRSTTPASDPAARQEDDLWQLQDMLKLRDIPVESTRNAGNLSCFARFAVFRPLVQWRDELTPFVGTSTKPHPNWLMLVYDGGSARMDGSQSLDFAEYTLYKLLSSPGMADLPVGVEVPAELPDLAPALYQQLITLQRFTAAEMIAAANGDGWALPMEMKDSSAYIKRSALLAQHGDLTGMSLFDVGGTSASQKTLTRMAANGWRGAIMRPIPGNPRDTAVIPGFTVLAGFARASSPAELRAAVNASFDGSFRVIYLDPNGLPPAALHEMLPELTRDHTLITPSQAFREMEEYARVIDRYHKTNVPRGKSGLAVSLPHVPAAEGVSVATALPVSLTIGSTTAGIKPDVMVARLIYQTEDGRTGAADLHKDPLTDIWTTIIPPALNGDTLKLYARVVDRKTNGITWSPPQVVKLSSVDSDHDGASDVLEIYQGTDPNNPDTDGDGLPDGLDPHPLAVDREMLALAPAYFPPADGAVLAETGSSKADLNGRVVPAGSSVTYHFPLNDLPTAPATLRVITMRATPDGALLPVVKDRPISAEEMAGKDYALRFIAKDKPLQLLSLEFMTNADGPYFHELTLNAEGLTKTDPFPAGLPIHVHAVVYSPKGMKAVRLYYGINTQTLQTLELTTPADSPVPDVVFEGDIPAQRDGTTLVYYLEAEDNAGHVSASPYHNAPIGRTRKYSVALIGNRELRGDWQPLPIWGEYGRVLPRGGGVDSSVFMSRPGSYVVWVMAQPRERGLTVTLKTQGKSGETTTSMEGKIPAGAPDGWFKVGTFSVEKSTPLNLFIAAENKPEQGYVSYGMVVITQDTAFTPLANTGIDWFNSLTVKGLTDGAIVTSPQSFKVFSTGNIDAITVKLRRTHGAGAGEDISLHLTKDGRCDLNPLEVDPGEYSIVVSGNCTTDEQGRILTTTLVTNGYQITIPRRKTAGH